MSLADELLDSLTDTEPVIRRIDPASEPHIVINADRSITVPEILKTIAVQHDHNIETVTFDCPYYWDGHDLTEMQIYVNCMRPDGVVVRCPITNNRPDETDENLFHFDWTISKSVTLVKGRLKFLVCAVLVDGDGNEESHWNSQINEDLRIAEGLESGTVVSEVYPDEITALLARVAVLERALEGGAVNTKKIRYVDVIASNWIPDGNRYYQIVEIEGVTEFSKINIQFSEEQREIFANKDFTIAAENHSGTVWIVVTGKDIPTNDYTFQCTIEEVSL